MSTPSRSHSSARGNEGYFEWREAMERRQLESKRKMQKKTVLRIQASSSGPSRDQRSRGQGANSRPDPKSIYPGTAGVIPDVDRDKRPQLSDAMRARLGPQEPGKTRPPVATTWETYPDPPVVPIVQNNPHIKRYDKPE
ncbi:hypothetical protein AAG906_034996 [Vitis piasezkii]